MIYKDIYSFKEDIKWFLFEEHILNNIISELSKNQKEIIIENIKDKNNNEMFVKNLLENELKYKNIKIEKKIKKEFLPVLAIIPEIGIGLIFECKNNIYRIQTKDGIIEIDNFKKNTLFIKLKEKIIEKKENAFNVLYKIALEQKILLFYMAIATFGITVLTLATSLYTMQVYDRVIPTNSISTLITLTVGVCIAIFLETIIKFSKSILLDYATKSIDIEYSNNIFERFLKINCDAIPKSIGTLSSQLQSYSSIRTFVITSASYIFIEIPFTLIFIIAIFIIGGIYMGIIPLIFLLISVLVGFIYKSKIEKAAKDSTISSYKKMGLMIETIENIETIKITGAGYNILNNWNKLNNDAINDEIKIKHYTESSSYFSVLFQQLSFISLVCLGAYLATQTASITMGTLLAITILSGRVLQPIAQLPNNFMQLGKAKMAINDLNKIYNLSCDNEGVDRPLTPFMDTVNLSLKNIEYTYEKDPILNINNLNIKQGEKIAILGPIGSGKTTLLKILAGLYNPTKGNIYLNNIDLNLIKKDKINEHINYLPQTTKLFLGTLRENLTFGMIGISDEMIIETCKKTGLINVINKLQKGLDTTIPEGGELFSGGQKQLIGITRTMIQNKSILLLDEPTASVDEMTEKHLINMFNKELSKEQTMIVVTHKPIILNMVDRIIVLNQNGIIIDGKKEDVLKQITRKGE